MTADTNQPGYSQEKVEVATDSAGKVWEIVSETRRTHKSGCVTRWIARREYKDSEGLVHFERITNTSGRTKRFHSKAACIAAVTGKRPTPAPKLPAETLW